MYSDKKQQNSANTDIQTVAGLGCYVLNHTGDWLRSLTSDQADVFISLMRGMARRIVQEGPMGKDARAIAALARYNKKKVTKAKNKENLRKQVKKHLVLRRPALELPRQLNVAFFDKLREESRSISACLRRVKQMVTVLKTCYRVPTRELISYSKAGDKFSPETIFIAFRVLLQRFETGDLELPKCLDIVDALLRDREAYRGGTESKQMKQIMAKRKKEYQDMIAKCKEEDREAQAKQGRSRLHAGVKSRKRKKEKLNLLGRTVLIPGDEYEMYGVWYKGKVTAKAKYREQGKNHWGWRVTFPPEEGKTRMQHEVWAGDKLIKYLVSGTLTAADLNDGNLIEPLDTVFELAVYDHVYAEFRGTESYFYGDIAAVCVGDEGVRTYTVLFDDGDVEEGVHRARIVFLDRPPASEVTDMMKEAIMDAVRLGKEAREGGEDSGYECLGSVLDLTGSTDVKIADPERGELTGHTDTCV